VLQKSEIKALKEIGMQIKKYRLKNDMSQHDLSIEAELPKNQIGRIERAEINTTVLTLLKICDALKIDIIQIFKKEK